MYSKLTSNPLLPQLDLDVDNLSDDYIAQLLVEEAKQKKEYAQRVGVIGYSSTYKEPSRTHTPNKRFFRNVIKNTIGFNQAELDMRDKDKEAYKRKRQQERDKDSAREKESVEKGESSDEQGDESFVGPKLASNENKFLLKTKARGRGGVGSNRLDQYFAKPDLPNEDAPTKDVSDEEKEVKDRKRKSKKEKKHKKSKKEKKHKKQKH